MAMTAAERQRRHLEKQEKKGIVRFTASLPEDVLAALDAMAKGLCATRAQALEDAVRSWLKHATTPQPSAPPRGRADQP